MNEIKVTGELVIWDQEGGPALHILVGTGKEEVSMNEMIGTLIPDCPTWGGPTGHLVEITIRLIPPC